MEEKIYTVYAESNDMTFIIKETKDIENDITIEEIIGYYHGEPNEENTLVNIGSLRAEW